MADTPSMQCCSFLEAGAQPPQLHVMHHSLRDGLQGSSHTHVDQDDGQDAPSGQQVHVMLTGKAMVPIEKCRV